MFSRDMTDVPAINLSLDNAEIVAVDVLSIGTENATLRIKLRRADQLQDMEFALSPQLAMWRHKGVDGMIRELCAVFLVESLAQLAGRVVRVLFDEDGEVGAIGDVVGERWFAHIGDTSARLRLATPYRLDLRRHEEVILLDSSGRPYRVNYVWYPGYRNAMISSARLLPKQGGGFLMELGLADFSCNGRMAKGEFQRGRLRYASLQFRSLSHPNCGNPLERLCELAGVSSFHELEGRFIRVCDPCPTELLFRTAQLVPNRLKHLTVNQELLIADYGGTFDR